MSAPMTAQRKRRGRKPATILNRLAGYTGYVGCGCASDDRQHDRSNVNGCARAHFASLIRELRAELKGAKT